MIEPKVVFANTTKVWGGGEKWHLENAKQLSLQLDVKLITNKRSELLNRAKELHLNCFNIKTNNLSFLNPLKIYRLIRFFKKERINTVILNGPNDVKLVGLSAKLAGVSKIIYRRGSAIPIKNNILNRFYFKYILTDIIANSEATKNTILQNNSNLFPREKISVIYNGIDFKSIVDSLDKAQNKPLKIGHLGRMEEQKNHAFLLDVALELVHRGLDFQLVFGGIGSLEKEIKQKAQELQIIDKIEFRGFVKKPDDFMRELDLFVLPSLWEGFGFVLVEALWNKVPVVTFNESSMKEIVVQQESGFLTPKNDLVSFCDSIEHLLKNQELRSKMGEFGHQYVKGKFTFDRSLENLKELILK